MTTQRDPASHGRYAKGVARRQQIIDTALAQFAERGVDSASMRVLSDAIGVSTATLSHYFASRDELLVEVYRAHEQRTAERLHDAGAVEVIAESAEHNLSIPGLVRLYATLTTDALQDSHPVTREFVTERFRVLRQVLSDRIRRAQDAGTVAAEIDPADAAALVIAASDGLQVQWLLDPEEIDMPRVLGLLELILPPPAVDGR